ncbi:hypothetical protein WS58_07125 [Burkholderia pseudomultivorans]|nr:hypothetical protein WS56_07975 [Burkholderia pseudomultivorans]KVC38426.1 hypothetical protein WS55_26960 [Burkholderia pseudomultivorans]KVC49326.1 hypothetical protein WS58_07125 [Burkholderia pseudomultivorans]
MYQQRCVAPTRETASAAALHAARRAPENDRRNERETKRRNASASTNQRSRSETKNQREK